MYDSKIDYLLNLIDNKTTLKKLSGQNKKVYQYIICGIFINVINGNNDKYYQDDLYYKAEEIINYKEKLPIKYYLFTIGMIQTSMYNNFIFSSEDPETPNKIISFFRKKLKELKGGKSLSQVLDFEEVMDIKWFMKRRGTPYLHNHNWIDFNLEAGLVHTTSVFILLKDIKVHWNHFIEQIERYKDLQLKLVPVIGQADFDNILEVREIRISYSGLSRTLIFTSVTFVEAFLLDIFINIREVYPHEKENFTLLKNNGKLTDKEIMEKLVFKMFPSIKSKVGSLYSIYKEMLEYRDRYVHASSYKEGHSDLSKLQYLIELETQNVKEYVNASVKLVKLINDELPKEIQSLYWWSWFDQPDFTRDNKISLLNKERPSNTLKDYEHILNATNL